MYSRETGRGNRREGWGGILQQFVFTAQQMTGEVSTRATASLLPFGGSPTSASPDQPTARLPSRG